MALDFLPLRMTELRARVGEAIESVAKEGHAYLVERKGVPLACIVPVSEYLPAIPPRRLQAELEAIAESTETLAVEIDQERRLVFRAFHEFAEGERGVIRIVLPHGYPHRPPTIYLEGLTKNLPHMWPDGALCTAGTWDWNPGRHDVLTALAWARGWLSHHGELAREALKGDG